jgi:hypothetical protein
MSVELRGFEPLTPTLPAAAGYEHTPGWGFSWRAAAAQSI